MADSNVNTPCPAYLAMASRWTLIDDLLGGTRRMREVGKRYLPKQKLESDDNYNIKIEMAVLYGGLGQAIDDATNRPFSKAVTFDGADKKAESGDNWLDEFLKNVDGAGMTADEQLREGFRTAAKYGMVHFLVDHTPVPQNATRADEQAIGARSTIVLIDPRQVIGWRSEQRGSSTILKEVRIRDVEVTIDDHWEEKTTKIVRVITPDSVTIWRERTGENGKVDWVADAPIPMLKDGKPLDRVPLFTAYFDRDGFMTANVPYEDLAHLNVAHWQSTAAQRYATAFSRIAVMYITGHTPKADVTSNDAPKEIKVTPASFMHLPEENAKVGFAEQSGAAIATGADEIRTLEEQMQTLGIRPFIERSSASTATGKSIDESRDMSVAQRWIRTLESVYRDAVEFAGGWAGKPIPADFAVRIFSDFVLPASQADLTTVQAARAAGDLSRETYLRELQRRGTLSPELDITRELDAITQEGPQLGLMTGGSGGAAGDAGGGTAAGGSGGSSGAGV